VKVEMLRLAVNGFVDGLGRFSHKDLTAELDKYGLPAADEGTKRERIECCISRVEEEALAGLARRILAIGEVAPADRNALEEGLWTEDEYPPIPRRLRHQLSRSILIDDLYIDWDGFIGLLDRLWVLDDRPFDNLAILFGNAETKGLRGQISRHVGQNIGDWSTEDLFQKIGAFSCSDRRFGLLLEGLSASSVLPDEEAQRRFVSQVNPILAAAAVELREADDDGGYPSFHLVASDGGHRGRPKNIIFGSPVKPDIRFRDAVDNDIEIVGNASQALVYDLPITAASGLLWSDLKSWWSEQAVVGAKPIDDGGRSLYRRLYQAIPISSPPQQVFFRLYHDIYREEYFTDLPALLPEVWLHWDPKAARIRGRNALLRFRMDFLMLLPHGRRVVIEVDGKHHYADRDGRADPESYARNMQADRDLKLSGYEVYRFGAVELQGDRARVSVEEFFKLLFARHSIGSTETPST